MARHPSEAELRGYAGAAGYTQRAARAPSAPLAELLAQLQSSSEGLSGAEAARRLALYGFNEPPRPRVPPLLRELLGAIATPLNLILLIAGGTAAILGQIVDAGIIGAMVFLSSALYFWQTFRSERAVARLQAEIAPTATVRRDQQWIEVERRRVVPGDVVRLAAGDLVPADARLLHAVDLHVQQAALTGESLPAEKRAQNGALPDPGAESTGLAFLGTSVVSGTATAVVYATGRRTAFGEIVEHLAARPEETEFERGARRFGILIMQTVLFLVLFVLVANLAVGRNALQSLLFSVALAVGLTPEFLPMITTVTLAQGAIRMAREKVIVKHLPSIQNLGSIDILCTDKTGTLTVGTMSFDASLDPQGRPSDRALRLAHLISRFQTGIRSPLDDAILKHGAAADPALSATDYVKTDEIPFDFERRALSVIVAASGRWQLISKGAPETLLAACSSLELDGTVRPLDAATTPACLEAFQGLSGRGLRVLAVAYKAVSHPDGFGPRDEHGMTLAGFVTFTDHVLEGVAQTVATLARDGVRVKILSGDNELVTGHVCAQAGLKVGRIILGRDIAGMNELALGRLADEVDVFARMSPTDKHRVIHALKAAGHVVGFLGDGINDAPSLHGADVGISAAGAVDVARESADIILLERRLDVLHAGILAGRRSFGNVLKYLLMGTSSNFGNMFSMAGAALWLPFLPMRPTQILLNNFLYDLAQVTIPTDNVDPLLMRRPQRWNISLIRNFMIVIGPLSSLFDFLTFYVLLRVFRFGETPFQSGWFLESLATQTLVLFVIRTAGRPWADRPSLPLTTSTLLVVLIGGALLYTPVGRAFGLQPLPATYLLFLAGIVGLYLTLVELVKERIMRRLLRTVIG